MYTTRPSFLNDTLSPNLKVPNPLACCGFNQSECHLSAAAAPLPHAQQPTTCTDAELRRRNARPPSGSRGGWRRRRVRGVRRRCARGRRVGVERAARVGRRRHVRRQAARRRRHLRRRCELLLLVLRWRCQLPRLLRHLRHLELRHLRHLAGSAGRGGRSVLQRLGRVPAWRARRNRRLWPGLAAAAQPLVGS